MGRNGSRSWDKELGSKYSNLSDSGSPKPKPIHTPLSHTPALGFDLFLDNGPFLTRLVLLSHVTERWNGTSRSGSTARETSLSLPFSFLSPHIITSPSHTSYAVPYRHWSHPRSAIFSSARWFLHLFNVLVCSLPKSQLMALFEAVTTSSTISMYRT